jgi:transaldolase
VASDITIESRIDTPVDPAVVEDLLKRFPDFGRAYDEKGLSLPEFDTFGSTRRTLRQFAAACAELSGLIRDVLIPNPDGK